MSARDEGLALPWAHAMSDHDLHGFLGDLVSAAMGRWQSSPEVPDREVLAAVEQVCAEWRTPGVGCRLDGSEFDGITVRIAPVQALRGDADEAACRSVERAFPRVAELLAEGKHYQHVHHAHKIPHDLEWPGPGGQQ